MKIRTVMTAEDKIFDLVTLVVDQLHCIIILTVFWVIFMVETRWKAICGDDFPSKKLNVFVSSESF